MLLDAPVSGSRDPAEQGQLTIFASGPEEARSRVAPLLDALGQRTIWVGGVGAGSRLKLVNNTLVALAAEGVATSVALAGRLGLATETVLDALGGGPLVSPWQAAKLARIAEPGIHHLLPLLGQARQDGQPVAAGRLEGQAHILERQRQRELGRELAVGGGRWPVAGVRHQMLQEAVEIIRACGRAAQ